MPVTFIERERTLSASLSGEVDHHAAREIMAKLMERIDAALPQSLTIDLSGVTFMDSSGIAVLLRAYRRMAELEGVVTVEHVPAQAGKVLAAAGLDRLMQFQ